MNTTTRKRRGRNGGANQQFTLRKVSYAGSAPTDFQLVARHSGKCVAVVGASTASGALLDQRICNPVNQGSPLNQTWRLPGRQTT
ncbi:ricin-type beta-trefoil lectin protein [Lentzea atacamensis]|uniref:Ricin-type beta-trefoil lectin protein n=1 Tax=Lentzea atacamensis TaxID=531938 RepID=A0ABX9EEN5_9PSEU|nr:RICIN domain-containing protein [Lentzea atacamensis]RAS67411.1 ricin-type beta-trefoil lectin protein [Lentzea atacamensis]